MKTLSIQFPSFIGRTKELTQIDRQVRRGKDTVLFNIAGPGGIGKTAILKKIKEQYRSAPDILVTDVIDFSHTVHRSEMWVMERIVCLAPKQFRLYQKIIRKLESASEPLTRLQYEAELVDAFVDDFNKIASEHRFVILFDTLELIQDSPLFVFVLELAKRLKNTVLLLAGRGNDQQTFHSELSRIFRASQVKNIRLVGFSEEEAMQYFEKTITPHLKQIHPNLRSNIYFLSDGRPIKISLSLDWLDRGIPIMPDVMKLESAELKKLPREKVEVLRCQFESALMDGIRQFQSPMDEVIVYMAHFNKRFNREMLEFFFLGELSPAERARESKKLIASIKELPFVKYTSDDYFVLHDEMSRLVQTYVWDTVEDPDRTLRKELSEKICQYYKEKIKALPEWKDSTEQERVTRRSYEAESLYYRLYADFHSGFSDFEKLFEDLVSDRRSGLAALVINFVREFQNEPAYSNVIRSFINGYYSGGVLIAQEKFEDATKRLKEGEQQLEEIFRSYDWNKAGRLDYYLRERSYLIYQQLGYCYRSMGDWSDAEENYQRALALALEVARKSFQLPGDSDRKKTLIQQIAEILNNLGNLYRLTGDLHQARLLCQIGILLRERWDLDTVMSLYVMSMIRWEMGDTAGSVVSLSKAEKSCTDEYRLALLKKYHGYILFRTGLADQALPMLDEAESIFRQKGRRSELADTLNVRCRIYRSDINLLTDNVHRRSYIKYIEELGEEAYLLATQSNDKFRIAECHLTRAFHYYQLSRTDPRKAASYRRLALEQWNQGVSLARARYHQIYSLYCQLRGDLAFDATEPDYELAFVQYTEQCKVGTHFKEASYERGIDHLGARLRELSNTDPERALYFIAKIIASWTEDKEVAHRTELVDELLAVKLMIEENEKLKGLKIKYEQAMLAGEWDKASQYSDEILKIPGFYTDANRAEVLLAKSRVAHRQERFGEARRYANLALQLGTLLKADALIGHAHLALTSILWDTTSTAEAADHLKTAKQIFEKIDHPLGLARAQRFECYILYRTGIYDQLIDKLKEIVEVFEKNQMNAETADLLNVMSRASRTNDAGYDYDMARKFAEKALLKAEASNDAYRKAECLLSLAVLCQREEKFKDVLAYYEKGIKLLPAEAHTIRTVYEGIQGAAYYDMARQSSGEERDEYWQKAFAALSREVTEAFMAKPASLVRTVELLFNFLVQLPSQEEMLKYSQVVEQSIKQWVVQSPQSERHLLLVQRLLEEVRLFYPFLQIDSGGKDAKS